MPNYSLDRIAAAVADSAAQSVHDAICDDSGCVDTADAASMSVEAEVFNAVYEGIYGSLSFGAQEDEDRSFRALCNNPAADRLVAGRPDGVSLRRAWMDAWVESAEGS